MKWQSMICQTFPLGYIIKYSRVQLWEPLVLYRCKMCFVISYIEDEKDEL